MSTATQLLNRSHEMMTSILVFISGKNELVKDIEAYLEKQQAVEIDPSTLQNIAEAQGRCVAKMPCGTLADNVYEAYEAGMKAKQQVEQETKSEFQRGYDLAISTTKQHVRHLNDELARWQEQHSHMLKQERERRAIASPPARNPMSEDDSKDAKRYQWLKSRLLGVDFDWQERCVLVFDWPKDVGVGGNCDMNIDAAIEAHHGIGVKS